jgi:hypothetical protein
VTAESRRQQRVRAEKMPRVNRTAMLDGLGRVAQRPPEHVRTLGMRSSQPGLLHQPGPRGLKG